MDFKIIKDIQVTNDFIETVVSNNKYNEDIIDYYYRLQQETELSFGNKIESIENCNKFWILDKYEKLKIKDFKKTSLCKDKFCNNCKKVKQASRMSKFIPILDKFKEEYDLYHVVLTIPNVCDHDDVVLKDTIKKMFYSYRKLNHYLLNLKKIRDVDFSKYGYVGSIRSLEVSYNSDSYHPHLHCIFLMKKDLNFKKQYSNVFSKSKKNGFRKFSDFEILIQRIWYLLNNEIEVTKKAIFDLDLGYSVMADLIEDNHYFEVFKYMTKSNSEEGSFITYNNFKTLHYALYRVRQIQGFGILYNIKDDIQDMENLVEEFYDNFILGLKEKDTPLEILESPKEVLEDDSYYVISRKKIFSYLKSL